MNTRRNSGASSGWTGNSPSNSKKVSRSSKPKEPEVDLTPFTEEERAEFFKQVVAFDTSPSFLKKKDDEKIDHI